MNGGIDVIHPRQGNEMMLAAGVMRRPTRADMRIPGSRMDEVLARAMTRRPEQIKWDETTTTIAAAVVRGDPGRGGSLDAHRALNVAL